MSVTVIGPQLYHGRIFIADHLPAQAANRVDHRKAPLYLIYRIPIVVARSRLPIRLAVLDKAVASRDKSWYESTQDPDCQRRLPICRGETARRDKSIIGSGIEQGVAEGACVRLHEVKAASFDPALAPILCRGARGVAFPIRPARDLSIPTRAVSSPARISPAC